MSSGADPMDTYGMWPGGSPFANGMMAPALPDGSSGRRGDAQRFVRSDVVPLTTCESTLYVLMQEIEEGPYAGHVALPGSYASAEQTLQECARHVIGDLASSAGFFLESCGVFDEPESYRGQHVASMLFVGGVPFERADYAVQSGEASLVEVRFAPPDGSVELYLEGTEQQPVFGNEQMIAQAILHTRRILDGSLFAFSLVPDRFTLLALQGAHEAILNRKLNKTLFRKQMLGRRFGGGRQVVGTGETIHSAYRPPELYELAVLPNLDD